MSKSILIERKDGEIITADYQQPDVGKRKENAPLVIMAHGFPKNQSKEVNFFGLIAEIISDMGFSSLIFDYTGSVNVSPEEDKFSFDGAKQDLDTIFAWAGKREYTSLAFIGEGLGAPIIFMNLPENAIFTILCWPVFDLSYVYSTQFKADEHKEELDKNGYFDFNGALVGSGLLDELQNTDLTPYLHEADVPTMVLHGVEDKVIPITHLDVARKDLMVPRLNITSFDDGEYGLTQANHRKVSIHYITEFIEKYCDYDSDEESWRSLFL